MSTTKLTLTIQDSEIIANAKAYAKASGRSLSNLVENYLKSLATSPKDDTIKEEEISPLIKSMTGIVKLPEGWDYKEALIEALEEKYMKE